VEYDSLSIPCFDTVGWVTGRACKKLGVGVFGGDDGGGGVKCSCRTCKARVIVPLVTTISVILSYSDSK